VPQTDDHEAFERLFRAHHPAVRAYGCSTTALKVRLHRARRRLRRHLGDADHAVRPTTARELAR
jgi:hypothetical protein